MAKNISNILVLLALLMPSASWSALADHAKIEAIGGSGSVTIKREGKAVQLKKGDLLQAGDELSTDDHSAADIRFDDQTLVRVGVNSTYKITEDAGTTKFLHRLFSGVVRVLVPVKKEAKTDEIKFKMKTPQGTIGVRGTEFTVTIAKNETTLRGLSGEVQFGQAGADYADASKFVYVGRGMESSISEGKAASPPVKYDLEKYQKEIDQANGVFGQMAKRSNLNLIRRGENKPVAVASAPAQSIGQPKSETAIPAVKAKPAVQMEKKSLEVQLVEAVQNKNLAKVTALIANGADVNFKGENDVTPLHYAVISEHLKIVQLLIMKGAKVNAVTKYGVTPLMQVAVDEVPVVIADLLVQNDADPKIKNRDGLTALDIAEAMPAKTRDEELIAFLRKQPH